MGQAENSKLKSKILQENQKLTTENFELKNEIKIFHEKVEELEIENSKLYKKLEYQKKDKQKKQNCENDLLKLYKDLNETENLNKQNLSKIEEQNFKIQKQNDKIQTVEKENEKLQSQIKELQSGIQSLKKIIDQLDKKLQKEKEKSIFDPTSFKIELQTQENLKSEEMKETSISNTEGTGVTVGSTRDMSSDSPKKEFVKAEQL